MKKITCILSALIMLLALVGCGAKAEQPSEAVGDTMTLEEVMNNIMTDVPDLPMVDTMALTADNFSYYAFVEPTDGVEGIVSEAMIGSIAHSVVLLRAADSASAEALAKDVEANMNPRKWICVEAEKSTVTVHGNTVLLVMSFTDTADAITANFNALY